VFAEDEARLLLEAAGPDEVRLQELVGRRVEGEPLEQVLGWADVAGVRVRLRPGVFVPRRRSALLVDLAVHALASTDSPVVVDLCCGSGALGLAVARSVPDVELHAADLDPVACACATDNLAGTGEVHEGDLLEALPARLRGRVDVLVVNAPYVPTADLALLPREAREHEPPQALDGGPDGTSLHRRVAERAHLWVRPGGSVLVETSTAQADATAAGFRDGPWSVTVEHDDDLGATVTWATRR
jgi:release factor glutamine methyltransferase